MFYSIPNLRSSTAVEMPEPWNYVPEAPPPYHDLPFMKLTWNMDFNTKHAFISGYEGLTPGVRITDADNPALKMHALIVDYDAKMPKDPVEYFRSNAPVEFMPAYIVETASHKVHLAWNLERSLLLTNQQQTKELLKALTKYLKLAQWHGAFDSGTFANPGHYYEIGRQWIPLAPEARIPAAHLEMWMVRASSELSFSEGKKVEYKIPIEDVAAEVEARFPGRWKGTFALRSRGVRFWDPQADNPTAAVVFPDGMLCFTGDRGFMTWKQIFGAAFVEQFESSYIAAATENTYYDEKFFWTKAGDRWVSWGKEDFSQQLRIMGYDNRRKASQTASPVDLIEGAIKTNKRVFKAAPMVFFPSGPVPYKGELYLNISTAKPLAPAPPVCEGPLTFSKGKEHFPLLHNLLKTMFVDKETTDDVQLTALLAWLRYFYVQSRKLEPRPGQAIVLAGAAGKGKTFLGRILGDLMGGSMDASDHLVEKREWTDDIAGSPILCIDDQVAAADPRDALRFSGKIKRFVANAEMTYNRKFRDPSRVPWFGRIVVTCNLDAESLRILPDMDISSRDKISLFKTSDHAIKFPDWDEAGRAVRRELPYFARFLEDWVIPEEWIADQRRFGVKPYHHPELFDAARQQSSGTFIEVLHTFLRGYKEHNPTRAYWEGSSTDLFNDLAVMASELMRQVRADKVATQLGRLHKNGYNIHRFQDPQTRCSRWRIGFDLNGSDLQEPVI